MVKPIAQVPAKREPRQLPEPPKPASVSPVDTVRDDGAFQRARAYAISAVAPESGSEAPPAAHESEPHEPSDGAQPSDAAAAAHSGVTSANTNESSALGARAEEGPAPSLPADLTGVNEAPDRLNVEPPALLPPRPQTPRSVAAPKASATATAPPFPMGSKAQITSIYPSEAHKQRLKDIKYRFDIAESIVAGYALHRMLEGMSDDEIGNALAGMGMGKRRPATPKAE